MNTRQDLLTKYGLPGATGRAGENAGKSRCGVRSTGRQVAVIKTQVHMPADAASGGVKVVRSRDEAAEVTKNLIAQPCEPTRPTRTVSRLIPSLVCEDMYPVQRELYLGAVMRPFESPCHLYGINRRRRRD